MQVRKSFLTLLYDMLAIAISLPIAMFLRVGGDIELYLETIIISTPSLLAISLMFFIYFKIPLRVWKYTSTEDTVAIIKAITISILIFLPLMFIYNRLEGMPRSLMVIDWFVVVLLLCAPRYIYRMIIEKTLNIELSNTSSLNKINIILIGATDHSEQFLRSIASNKQSIYRVVAIIDEDSEKRGKYIRGVKVHGAIKHLKQVIEKLRKSGDSPQKIIIAPDSFTGDKVQNILNLTENTGLTLSRLPRMTDFSQASSSIPLRPIALEDLLGRAQANLDKDSMRHLIENKRILITGAGGSIGAELSRQIANYQPAHLCLLDNSEYNLYEIDMEIADNHPELSRSPIIADVRDLKNIEFIFDREMPHIIFHAAALKHVPMSEINAAEAFLTNVIGTRNIADSCVKFGAEEMVMISTDKAVNPTNVMGATKRLAESYTQSLGNSKKAKKTKFVTIRFGNVLGSTGSVIPLFKKQIAKGGPITVTHPEVKRYFMTIGEAVELVIQSGAMTKEDASGDSKIFVLDMGEPVLITNLARQLIILSGLVPDEDIKIEYTGMRPGEKLFEELFHGEESPVKTDSEGILLAHPRQEALSAVAKSIKKIQSVAALRNDAKTIELLRAALKEFK